MTTPSKRKLSFISFVFSSANQSKTEISDGLASAHSTTRMRLPRTLSCGTRYTLLSLLLLLLYDLFLTGWGERQSCKAQSEVKLLPNATLGSSTSWILNTSFYNWLEKEGKFLEPKIKFWLNWKHSGSLLSFIQVNRNNSTHHFFHISGTFFLFLGEENTKSNVMVQWPVMPTAR